MEELVDDGTSPGGYEDGSVARPPVPAASGKAGGQLIQDMSNAGVGTFAALGFRERTIDPSGKVKRVARPR